MKQIHMHISILKPDLFNEEFFIKNNTSRNAMHPGSIEM